MCLVVVEWWRCIGHTPLSKAAYAGKRHVCEFFLGVSASATLGSCDATSVAATGTRGKNNNNDINGARLNGRTDAAGTATATTASGTAAATTAAAAAADDDDKISSSNDNDNHQKFARLRVPMGDLLIADGHGFRPADIARVAGFERLGDWLSRLMSRQESAQKNGGTGNR